MTQILRQTLILAGAFCLTLGGIAAQPGSFDKQEPFKTQYILGVNFVPEWQVDLRGRVMGGRVNPKFAPNVGLSFETRLTRHSGIETGFYYRNVKYSGGTSLVYPSIRYGSTYSRYFSIPVLYKYYSRILNVGAGISYDIRFSQSENGSSEAKNRFGLVVKVSKNITLYKGLFLEPEFHFNPFWEDGEINHSWIGLALGLKYRF